MILTGRGPHSQRLIKLIRQVEIPENLKCVFIASATDKHLEDIKKYIYEGYYIYCEKPPVKTSAEIDYLQNLPDDLKRRIYFNFNYTFTDLVYLIEDVSEIEKMEFLSVKTALNKNGDILERVGIHYIHLCMWLMGRKPSVQIINGENSTTIDMCFKLDRSVKASARLSYNGPFLNMAFIYTKKRTITIDHKTQWDSFDYYNKSLVRSIEFFVDRAVRDIGFNESDFKLALDANKIILGENI